MNIEEKLLKKQEISKWDKLRLAVATLSKFTSEVLMAGKATERGCISAFKAVVILARISGIDFEKLERGL